MADARGVSYYSDSAAGKLLTVSTDRLREARAELVAAGLVAYRAPFYQVLSLEPAAGRPASPPPPRPGEVRSVRDIVRAMIREASE